MSYLVLLYIGTYLVRVYTAWNRKSKSKKQKGKRNRKKNGKGREYTIFTTPRNIFSFSSFFKQKRKIMGNFIR